MTFAQSDIEQLKQLIEKTLTEQFESVHTIVHYEPDIRKQMVRMEDVARF